MQVLSRLCAIRCTRALSSPVCGRLDESYTTPLSGACPYVLRRLTYREFGLLWAVSLRGAYTFAVCNECIFQTYGCSYQRHVSDACRFLTFKSRRRCWQVLCASDTRRRYATVGDGVLRTLCLWACDNTALKDTHLSLSNTRGAC